LKVGGVFEITKLASSFQGTEEELLQVLTREFKHHTRGVMIPDIDLMREERRGNGRGKNGKSQIGGVVLSPTGIRKYISN